MNEQGCHILNKGSNYSALLDPFKDSVGKLCPDGRFQKTQLKVKGKELVCSLKKERVMGRDFNSFPMQEWML